MNAASEELCFDQKEFLKVRLDHPSSPRIKTDSDSLNFRRVSALMNFYTIIGI